MGCRTGVDIVCQKLKFLVLFLSAGFQPSFPFHTAMQGKQQTAMTLPIQTFVASKEDPYVAIVISYWDIRDDF